MRSKTAIKTTFILKRLTDAFYDGTGGLPGLLTMTTEERYAYLVKLVDRRELQITQKVGNNTVRENYDFNMLMRGAHTISGGELEKRRGYNLMSFEVVSTEDEALYYVQAGF